MTTPLDDHCRELVRVAKDAGEKADAEKTSDACIAASDRYREAAMAVILTNNDAYEALYERACHYFAKFREVTFPLTSP
jgi:hypothetical protein